MAVDRLEAALRARGARVLADDPRPTDPVDVSVVVVAGRADSAYVGDLTFGPQPWLRGTWADRLAAIDADIVDLEDLCRSQPAREPDRYFDAGRFLDQLEATGPDASVSHEPSRSFRAGADLLVVLEFDPSKAATLTTRGSATDTWISHLRGAGDVSSR